MQSTSPSTIHPIGILIVFILFYVLALGLLTFLVRMIGLLLRILPYKNNHVAITLQQSYYYASVLALAPVMLVGMRSIGYTRVYDLVLIILFEIIACFYIYS